MKLLAKNRGNLPEFMKVSVKDGEEHFQYAGRLIFSAACDLLARWMLGGNKDEISPLAGPVMVAEDRNERWIMNRGRVNRQECEMLFGEAMFEKEPKMNVFAQKIDFYDLERENGAEKAFAHLERRHGSTILTYLDASTDEVAGMIHECKAVHVPCDEGFATKTFLAEVAAQRVAASETGKKNLQKEPTEAEIKAQKEAEDKLFMARLQMQLANRRA